MATSNSTGPPQQQVIQNFHLVWLDGNFDENKDDYRSSVKKLRQITNQVNTFVNADECIEFINSIQEETGLMIFSGTLGQTTVPAVHDKQQVREIYIFCGNKARHEQWAKDWPKVKGVFTDIKPICEALKRSVEDCDQNAVFISLVKPAGRTSSADKDTLDSSFMYTQILKDVLLTIEFDDGHIKDFVKFSREMLAGNEKELKNVDKIQKEYRRHQPIWWYTYDSFLYSMLNKALRLMDVDVIIRMGFFLCDLHNDIKKLHSKQLHKHILPKSFHVFRGQNLSQTDFDQMKQKQGGLLAFNNFLTASPNRNVPMHFFNRAWGQTDMANVLFVMRIDSSIETTPFANIKDVSYYSGEDEVLFSTHSVFRIGQIKKLVGANEIWEVELTLTSDTDPELRALTKHIQEEISSSYTGWHRLGKLLIKLAQHDKAKELYEVLLKQTNDQGEKAQLTYQLGQVYNDQGKYVEAVASYEKSLEIKKKTLPPNHPDLASSYNNIGLVYKNMGEYAKALEYHAKSLEIKKKTLPPIHPGLADSYHNIGSVYEHMGECAKALEHYTKSLEIRRQVLPENHPGLGDSYSNIASAYFEMTDYNKALDYFQRALDIWTRSLPPHHSSIKDVKKSIETVKKKL